MMPRHTAIAVEAGRILIPIAIVAAGVAVFWSFGRPPQPQTGRESGGEAALVVTDVVAPFDGRIFLHVDGVATPFRRIKLAAEVDGRVTRQSPQCRGGKFVDKQEDLLEIDPTDYSLDIRRLQSQLRQAEEELAGVQVDVANTHELIRLAEENLTLWRRELARNEKLTTTSAVTEAALDEVRRQELSGRNELQTQKNQLAALDKKQSTLEAAREMIAVQLEQAREVLTRTRIASPVAGTVVVSHVEEGDYVKKGDPLVEIAAARPMEVRCNLRIDELYWVLLSSGVSPGAAAAATEESLAATAAAAWEIPRLPVEVVYRFSGMEFVWDGVLSRYEGTGLDEQTRTVPCRVLVDAPLEPHVREAAPGAGVPAARLISGMYVRIRIPIDPPVPLVAVPESAVRPGNQVWLVRDGKLRIATVDVAKVDGRQVLVRAEGSPLAAGDLVVTSPLAAVQEGMAVRGQVE